MVSESHELKESYEDGKIGWMYCLILIKHVCTWAGVSCIKMTYGWTGKKKIVFWAAKESKW